MCNELNLNKKFFERIALPAQVFCLAMSVACWQLLFELHEGADTHFVMNLGQYIFAHGFPHVDPFTIHENIRLVAQQWLSGIIFWEVCKNFGVDGLRLTDALVGTLTLIIFWRLCLFVSGGNKILSFVLSLAVGLFSAPFVVPRPQIFSTLLLTAEVFALEKFTRTADAKFLLALPTISLALVNLHAAMWLMSLVVCVPFMFVRNARHVKFLLAAMTGIFLCGLINPYGLDAMTYVFRSYGVKLISENVPEMLAPTAHDVSGKIFYFAEALVIFSQAKFKVPWRYVLLSGGITFLALMHVRSLPLFYFLATFPLACAWKNFRLEKFGAGRAFSTILLLLLLTVNTAAITLLVKDGLQKISLPTEILFGAATLFMLYNLLFVRREGRILHPTILPRKNFSLLVTALIVSGIYFSTLIADKREADEPYTAAIKFILRDERPENVLLYVEQGIGGTAGSFGVRYYIDARSEVFLPVNSGGKNILAEYVDFMFGKISYRDFFARYPFTHIIVTSKEAFLFDQLSHDKNFRVVYESERVEGYQVVRCKIFVPKEFH